MKNFKKPIFTIVSLIIVFGLGVYVFGSAIKKVNDYEIYTKPKTETSVYTIWHCETFEGGSKARINYLKDIAKQIEKSNPGILFMIKQIEPEQLELELKNNKPDIISFGYGLGKIVFNNLLELNNCYNVRDELIISSSFNNKLYCLPYIVSGYAMITHGKQTDNFHCGTSKYTKPDNIYNNLNIKPVESESCYEAYKDFVYNTNVTLLGTGRDVFRVNNLNNIGRTSAIITPNENYTDLIQYLGITKDDNITNSFLNIALNSKQQSKLVEYNLFSSLYNKLYFTGIYTQMEDAISKCKIARLFYD